MKSLHWCELDSLNGLLSWAQDEKWALNEEVSGLKSAMANKQIDFQREMQNQSETHMWQLGTMQEAIKNKDAECAKFKDLIENQMKVRIEELSRNLEETKVSYENEITSLIKSKTEALDE